MRAVQQKAASETISEVLYPPDCAEAGRELRLIQEYFLVACAIRDIVARHRGGTGGSAISPTGSPSSSTTPIPRWPSPS